MSDPRDADIRFLINSYTGTAGRQTARALNIGPPLPLRDATAVDWPDGEGVEVGNLRATWSEVMRAFCIYREIGTRPTEEVFSVVEDGLQAIVILRAGEAPIVLTEPEDFLPDVVGIISGIQSDPQKVALEVQHMLRVGIGVEPGLRRKSPQG